MKFVGFDMIPALAEETNFPRQKLFIAFLGALGLTVLIYGMAIIGVGGIFHREYIMNLDIVDPRVADAIGLHWLGVVIVVMGAGTCLTTLSSFWLSGSRTLYGAANQGQFHHVFSILNKNGQPRNANIAIGICSLYFTVFAPDAWINYIYSIYGFAAGVVYFLVTISFWKLRRAKPDWKRPYRVRAPFLIFLISLIFTIYVIYTSLREMTIGSWYTVFIYLIAGGAIWYGTLERQKKNPAEWPRIILNPDNTPLNGSKNENSGA
jgi:APA family basic amino acid/polyamine antiporter